MSYTITEYLSILPQTETSIFPSSIPSTLSHCQTTINNNLLYLYPQNNKPSSKTIPLSTPKSTNSFLSTQFRNKRSFFLKSASDKTILNLIMLNPQKFNEYITLSSNEDNINDINSISHKRKSNMKIIPKMKKELKIETDINNQILSNRSNKNVMHRREKSAGLLECGICPLKKQNLGKGFKLKMGKCVSKNKYKNKGDWNVFRKRNSINSELNKKILGSTMSLLTIPKNNYSNKTVTYKTGMFHKKRITSSNNLISKLRMFQRNK